MKARGERTMTTPKSTATAIRSIQDLSHRIESNPTSAAQLYGMDAWQRWLLGHGIAEIVMAGLDEWEVAALECIVRHSGDEQRIPQGWLFDGGPDDDPRLRQLSCLNANARKVRLTRLVTKFTKLRAHLRLAWKVERAADCSKTIGTASISIVSGPRFTAADRR